MECLPSLCYLNQKSLFLENDCFTVFVTGYLDFPVLVSDVLFAFSARDA